jgi:DNA mismatch endonuclease, patch repair protein
MDILTKEQRRRNMQAIKGKDTKIEVSLAKALWHKGYRYRRNNKKVAGKPDLTFKSLKIAIFCDSEFFHGKDWESEKFRIKTNREFWWKKIEGNIERDKMINQDLKKQGYIVLRFWGDDIKKRLDKCVETIEQNIQTRRYEKI